MNFLLKNKNLMIIIFLAGLVLRIWGIGFGLPFVLHQDEPIIINHALAYGSGDLNPHFFIVPPACSYLLFACYIIFFVLGKMLGIFSGVSDFAVSFFNDPTYFYLIARSVLGVIPGTVSILLTYFLCKRFFSEKGAAYAASIVAVSFLAVVNSHYAYVDNMMVMFVLLTYLSIANMMRKPSLKNYIISGMLLGLSTGVKYNSGLLIVPIFLTHAFVVSGYSRKKTDIVADKNIWMAMIAAVIAFIAVNPFSVIDWQYFSASVPGKIRSVPMGWTHHLTYSLREGMGWGLVIPGIAGALLMFRKAGRGRSLVFLSFPALFYIHLALGSQRFSRYVLALVPFLAIGAGYLVFEVVLQITAKRWQRYSVIICALMLLIPATLRSITADRLFSAGDTRAVSAKWIEENLPQGARIGVDHSAFRPQIFQTYEQIMSKQGSVGAEDGLKQAKQDKLLFMAKAAENRKTYNVYFLSGKGIEDVQFLSATPTIPRDIDVLRKGGMEYVVINYNTLGTAKEEFIMELEKSGDRLAGFSPYKNGAIRQPLDSIDHTFLSIDASEAESRKLTGPCLVLYKLKRTSN